MTASLLFRIELFIFYALILLLPTQLGLHFWPDFSYVLGIRVDYLAPTIYFTDTLVFLLFSLWAFRKTRKTQTSGKIRSSESLKVRLSGGLSILSVLKKNGSPSLVFLIFTIFLLFNIFFSGRVIGGLYYLLKFLEMAFLAYYTAKFTPHHHNGEGFVDLKKHLPKIFLLLSFGVIFESLLAISQYLRQGSIGGILYFLGERTFNASTPGIANASLNGELVLRPYGTFPHPNVLAGYLVVVLTLVLFYLPNLKQKKVLSIKYYVLCISTLVLGTIALFLSMSRVAILLWIMVLFWFLIRHSGLPRISHVSAKSDSGVASLPRMTKKMLGIVILGLTIFFLLSPIGSRFTNINIADEAVVQRRILIDKSFEMMRGNPLLGIGLGNFIPTLATIQKPLTVSTYFQPVHNIFLLVAAEMGLIGLTFFTWFLRKTFQRVKGKASSVKAPLLIAFSAILILGLFDHYWLTLQQGQLLFAFILGLCYNPFSYGKESYRRRKKVWADTSSS